MSTVLPEVPAGSPRITGLVHDAVFRGLPGVLIESVDGPDAGRSTKTDGGGYFTLAGNFSSATSFRASKEGFLPATGRLSATQPHQIYFRLGVALPSVDIAGDYRMTFVAERCNGFPAEFARRTYLASIAAATITDQPGFVVAPNSTFNLQLRNAEVLDDGFSAVGVAGSVVGLAFYNDGYPFIIEKVADNRWVAITGYAITSAAAGGIVTASVPFDGWIAYHDHHPSWHYAPLAECRSANHQLLVERP
jgi:hypothetical protein